MRVKKAEEVIGLDVKTGKGFFATHFLSLVSLVGVYFIPRVCAFPETGLLPPSDRYVRFYIIGVLSLAFLSYGLYLYFYSRSNVDLFDRSAGALYFWISTALVLVFLCSSRAVLSTDLYEYSMRGRMLSIYGLNPYLHIPSEISGDMFYPYLFWKDTPECYGPAWVLIGAIPTLLFRESISLTVFLHKVVLLGFLTMSGYFLFRICRVLGLARPGLLTLAFVTNPLVLVMTVVDGHNEIAMTAFMLAALYYLVNSRYVPALVLFAVAVQVKFIYVLIAPIFLIYAFMSPGSMTPLRRAVELAKGAVLSVVVAVLFWAPFGWESVLAIVSYYRDLGGLFWPDSLPYVVFFLFREAGATLTTEQVARVFTGLFGLIYIYALYRFIGKVRSDRQSIFTYSALVILALLFTNHTPFQAWYLIWALPFIFLGKFSTKTMMVFFLTYFLLMTFWKRMSALAIPMAAAYLAVYGIKARWKSSGGILGMLDE